MTTIREKHTASQDSGRSDIKNDLSLTRNPKAPVIDDVFGRLGGDGPNYRNVSWRGTIALMMKTQIGLGVLSIPDVLNTMGLIPGVIMILIIAIITTWAAYIIGDFKLQHRSIYGIDDVGEMLFGPIGREIFAIAFILFWIFVAGAGMLSISISLNAITDHGTCTAVYVGAAFLIAFVFGSIQTLGRLSWLAWLGVFCILTAILTVTIAVSVQDRPAAASEIDIFVSDYQLFKVPTLTDFLSKSSALVFAFAGAPAYFAIVSEMREPKHFTRSLAVCQSVVTSAYVTIGVVMYYYCGSYVSSPAIGSAGYLVKKVAYGFALPGLCVSTVLATHVAAKYVFLRLLRGSHHLNENTVQHWTIWLGCTGIVSLTAYVIASAIPVFGGLVALVGALFGNFMCIIPMACMWFYDHWKDPRTVRWYIMVIWSTFVILFGCFLMIGGTYGSIVGIMDSYKESGGTSAWSCADNSIVLGRTSA